jgi:D-alanyl-lipoteichoic acid acyltransferase DltB (MBOAT superfamily)
VAYLVDVYRGTTAPVRSPLKMSLFVAFFPQLISGPIRRANEFLPQLETKRPFDSGGFFHGLDLIAIGLFKKILVADELGTFVDKIFASPGEFGGGLLLLGVYCYAIQIYCDFSGYIDIARGCGYCLGYELPVNFDRPYFSANIVEFWRRWHITLGSWLRDYLYIPLGGNRGGPLNTYRNLMITMTLCGLWHGASWCFVFWGMLHGAAMCLTRLVQRRRAGRREIPSARNLPYRALAILGTFNLVCLGWVFFRAPTFGVAIQVLKGIVVNGIVRASDLVSIGWITIGYTALAILLLALLHGLFAAARRSQLQRSVVWVAARPVFYFLITVGVMLYADRGAQQFIYFQF